MDREELSIYLARAGVHIPMIPGALVDEVAAAIPGEMLHADAESVLSDRRRAATARLVVITPTCIVEGRAVDFPMGGRRNTTSEYGQTELSVSLRALAGLADVAIGFRCWPDATHANHLTLTFSDGSIETFPIGGVDTEHTDATLRRVFAQIQALGYPSRAG